MPEDAPNNAGTKSDLRKIAEVMLHHGVEFIVIGGQAETLMGSPRVTLDVDLCYRRSPQCMNVEWSNALLVIHERQSLDGRKNLNVDGTIQVKKMVIT